MLIVVFLWKLKPKNFDQFVATDCKGRSGGTIFMWRDIINCSILSFNENMLFCYIEDNNFQFWLTCNYMSPKMNERIIVWEQVIQFSKNIKVNDNWIVLGDFNQVICFKDKFSTLSNDLKGAGHLLHCLETYNLSKILEKGSNSLG